MSDSVLGRGATAAFATRKPCTHGSLICFQCEPLKSQEEPQGPPTYPIGTRFEVRYGKGKRTDLCTVTDILKTYNAAGELVRIRYVATHEFLGQTVTNHDICSVTIAKGLI